jgi:hypothetical protein
LLFCQGPAAKAIISQSIFLWREQTNLFGFAFVNKLQDITGNKGRLQYSSTLI